MTFFARPTVMDGEPLVGGFFVRLCESNGLPSMRWLFDLVRTQTGQELNTSVELAANRTALAYLEGELNASPGALVSLAWNLHRTETEVSYTIAGKHWQDELLMTRHAQVCPACLAEQPVAKTIWLRGDLPVCPEHGLVLLRNCPDCGGAISNERTVVCHCGRCGYDLRRSAIVEVSTAACRLASHTTRGETLLLGTAQHIEPLRPQEMARLISLMSSALGRKGAIPDNVERLDAMSASVRVQALEVLASMWDRERIACAPLREFFLAQWPYLERTVPLLRFRRLECLFDGRRIPHELVNLILYDVPDDELVWAVHRLGSDTPYIETVKEAAEFVGTSEEELSELIRITGFLQKTLEDWCFDADELVIVKRFISEMMSSEKLDVVFGLANASAILERTGMLKPWSPLAPAARRFAPWSIAGVMDQLWRAIQDAAPTSRLISLDQAALQHGLDATALGQVLTLIVNGGLTPRAWTVPYRITDLYFDETAITAAVQGPLLREFIQTPVMQQHENDPQSSGTQQGWR